MSKTRNSLYTYEIVMSDPTYQWKRVSNGNSDVYVPWNAPVRAQGRIFAFRELKSRDEAIAPSVEGKRACDGDGDQNGGDGSLDGGDVNGDGTASGGNVNSTQVDGVQLAGEAGQHERSNAQIKTNIPVSPRPPIQHTEHPH